MSTRAAVTTSSAGSTTTARSAAACAARPATTTARSAATTAEAARSTATAAKGSSHGVFRHLERFALHFLKLFLLRRIQHTDDFLLGVFSHLLHILAYLGKNLFPALAFFTATLEQGRHLRPHLISGLFLFLANLIPHFLQFFLLAFGDLQLRSHFFISQRIDAAQLECNFVQSLHLLRQQDFLQLFAHLLRAGLSFLAHFGEHLVAFCFGSVSEIKSRSVALLSPIIAAGGDLSDRLFLIGHQLDFFLHRFHAEQDKGQVTAAASSATESTGAAAPSKSAGAASSTGATTSQATLSAGAALSTTALAQGVGDHKCHESNRQEASRRAREFHRFKFRMGVTDKKSQSFGAKSPTDNALSMKPGSIWMVSPMAVKRGMISPPTTHQAKLLVTLLQSADFQFDRLSSRPGTRLCQFPGLSVHLPTQCLTIPRSRTMRTLIMTLAAAMVLPTIAKADHHEPDKNIVETAIAGKFKTLVAAVKAADLVEALGGKGPLTVFAPTDEAFEKLPKGTIENLLKPENKDKLIAVLGYHVVKGKYPAKKVLQSDSLKTLQGGKLTIKQNDDGVTVSKAKVLKSDILCSNGVIHVIDSVMLPKE